MNENEMIQSLRAEIAKLQRVLDLLLGEPSASEEVRRPGRPKGSGNRATSFNPEELAPKKRTMSAEGKARIAAAQKKRWAAQKSVPSKFGRKATPAAFKKGTVAGKRTGSTQVKTQSASAKRSAAVGPLRSATKKSAAKRPNQLPGRSAKQASSALTEFQATA